MPDEKQQNPNIKRIKEQIRATQEAEKPKKGFAKFGEVTVGQINRLLEKLTGMRTTEEVVQAPETSKSVRTTIENLAVVALRDSWEKNQFNNISGEKERIGRLFTEKIKPEIPGLVEEVLQGTKTYGEIRIFLKTELAKLLAAQTQEIATLVRQKNPQ